MAYTPDSGSVQNKAKEIQRAQPHLSKEQALGKAIEELRTGYSPLQEQDPGARHPEPEPTPLYPTRQRLDAAMASDKARLEAQAKASQPPPVPEKYRDWTPAELIEGRVLPDKTYIPPPTGSGRTQAAQPDWLKATLAAAQQRGIEQLQPYTTTEETGKTVVSGKGSRKETVTTVDLEAAIASGVSEDTLKAAGFKQKDIAAAGRAERSMLSPAKQKELAKKAAIKGTVADAQELSFQSQGIVAAELAVPFLLTGRHWKELSPGEKAFYFAADVVSLLPVATGAVAGARAVVIGSRAARLAGAARGAGAGAAGVLRAPIDLLINPKTVAKAGYANTRSFLENAFSRKRLPSVVVGTTDRTIKIPITKGYTAEQILALRDKLSSAAMRGKAVQVEVDGVAIELRRSPLMRELGGGAAHATPQGEKFAGGLVVEGNPGMPIKEHGLFLGPEPYARFAETSAFGKTGGKPVIYITSPETAEKAISSSKLYRGTAELEGKFPVGVELPPPAQKLYTRVGGEATRVELWLEKPLSARQIAKLKIEGLAESVKTLYSPPYRIKGMTAGLTEAEYKRLASIISEGDINRGIARSMADNQARVFRPGTIAPLTRQAPPDFGSVTGRAPSRTTLPPAQPARPRIEAPARREVSPAGIAEAAAYSLDRMVAGAAEVQGVRIPAERDAERGARDTAGAPRGPAVRPPSREPAREAAREAVRPTAAERRAAGREAARPASERPPARAARAPAPARVPPPGRARVPRGGPPPALRVPPPPRVPPPRVPPPPPGKVPPPPPPGAPPAGGEGTVPGGKMTGTIAQKQGFGWWVIPPAPQKPYFTRKRPEGAVILDPKTGKPSETVQTISGVPPVRETADMGIMDVVYSRPQYKRPGGGRISFRRDTRQSTKLNRRLGGNTRINARSRRPVYKTKTGGITRRPG